MTNGICPKCTATHVYRCAALGEQRALPIGFWLRAPLTYYACTQCGYLEQYILDEEKLEAVRTKAEYVTPQPA